MNYVQIEGLVSQLTSKANTSGDNISTRSTFNDNIGSKVFADIAARDDYTPQIRDTAFVTDASADVDVTTGWGFYKYYNLGEGGEWVLLMKQAGMSDLSGTDIVTKLESIELESDYLNSDFIQEGDTNKFLNNTDKDKYDDAYNYSVYSISYEVHNLTATLDETDETINTDFLPVKDDLANIKKPMIFVNSDFYPPSLVTVSESVGSTLDITFVAASKPYEILTTWDIVVWYPETVKSR